MKGPIRQKNRVIKKKQKKTESCGENLWNEIQLKWLPDRNRHQNRRTE